MPSARALEDATGGLPGPGRGARSHQACIDRSDYIAENACVPQRRGGPSPDRGFHGESSDAAARIGLDAARRSVYATFT